MMLLGKIKTATRFGAAVTKYQMEKLTTTQKVVFAATAVAEMATLANYIGNRSAKTAGIYAGVVAAGAVLNCATGVYKSLNENAYEAALCGIRTIESKGETK